MMDAFAAGLVRRGLPRFDIFSEVFRSPPEPLVADGKTYVVRFGKTGVDHRWGAQDGPLLSFAERLGLTLPSGCRVGQCEKLRGACRLGQRAPPAWRRARRARGLPGLPGGSDRGSRPRFLSQPCRASICPARASTVGWPSR
ncbi:MAG: hypothetical protein GAK30_00271 [Paracidovorax wautersii]|uniref:Uncharacterized protein n=1 Tax=Paracidovorax wautersii TaxID=1177982 RepID=A0A7V8JS65_9BURK|nr:MAG: hypothetical protein GAK30_00271 [Paracidovorax wautersii]